VAVQVEQTAARFPVRQMLIGTGVALGVLGIPAFNLGAIGLYVAFLPLLCGGLLLFVEVGEGIFLPFLLLAVAGTLLYAVGLFALPLVLVSLGIIAALGTWPRHWRMGRLPETVGADARPVGRVFELIGILLIALFVRYLLYFSVGGDIPHRLREFESLTRFVVSEIGGWVVFALGYGVQHRQRYGVFFMPGLNLAASLPSLVATGLFLISPHVVILTLGLNLFGIAGLYVGTLPVGAAHVLMRSLTLRRTEIERHNQRLRTMNIELARHERMAAIGQMSSAISHQMLQKVGLLGLQCELLRDLLQDQTISAATVVADAQEQVGQLDATIVDLNTTLSDLLIFSRDFALNLDGCLVELLLRQVSEEVRASAAACQVNIIYQGETTIPPLLLDPIKMKQALLNLVVNAVDASPAGSSVEVTGQQRGDEVYITVKDQGRGITEQDMEQIFTPFFSTKERGIGLGLSFAQKIVELHGGTLTARNNTDGGATFVVALPVRSAVGMET
jgi:signal transduction histidine kinase